MSPVPDSLQTHIARYFDDEDLGALDEVCRLASTTGGIDIAALLDFVNACDAERSAKARMLRRLRAALGLPAMPGPVCRPTPFD